MALRICGPATITKASGRICRIVTVAPIVSAVGLRLHVRAASQDLSVTEPPEFPPSESGPEPLPGRVLGTGARGVRRVAELTGVNRAVEVGAEEAIVRAAESPAAERAFARILQGPMV